MKHLPASHAPPVLGLILLTATAFLSSCDRKVDKAATPDIPWNDSVRYGTLTDSRDQQVYRTVVVGSATWMAQNLNYAGSAGKKVGAWYKDDADSGAKYGRLYSWVESMDLPDANAAAVWGGSSLKHRGICPEAWHVPSDSEWTLLTTKALDPSKAGEQLKSLGGWIPDGSGMGNGTDKVGFRALPGGENASTYEVSGVNAAFWTASESFSDYAWFRIIYNGSDRVNRFASSKSYGFSLRCVED